MLWRLFQHHVNKSITTQLTLRYNEYLCMLILLIHTKEKYRLLFETLIYVYSGAFKLFCRGEIFDNCTSFRLK